MCRTLAHSLYRVSNFMYAFQPLWSGSHCIHRSNMALAFATWPIISSMCMYLYQNWSTRGRRLTVLSHTPRVVDKLVRHLHLRVLEPQALRPVVVVQGALPYGPRSGEVLLSLLPFRVLDPHGLLQYTLIDEIFELLALLEAVLGELLGVRDLLLGRAEGLLLALLSLAHDLLGGDLRSRGGGGGDRRVSDRSRCSRASLWREAAGTRGGIGAWGGRAVGVARTCVGAGALFLTRVGRG